MSPSNSFKIVNYLNAVKVFFMRKRNVDDMYIDGA